MSQEIHCLLKHAGLAACINVRVQRLLRRGMCFASRWSAFACVALAQHAIAGRLCMFLLSANARLQFRVAREACMPQEGYLLKGVDSSQEPLRIGKVAIACFWFIQAGHGPGLPLCATCLQPSFFCFMLFVTTCTNSQQPFLQKGVKVADDSLQEICIDWSGALARTSGSSGRSSFTTK